MKSMKVLVMSTIAVLALSVQPVSAQGQGAVELGFDARFAVDVYGDAEDGTPLANSTRFDLPGQRVRIGFWVSDEFSIEPGVSLSFLDDDDISESSITQLSLDLSALYHFGVPGETQVYIRGGGVLDLLNVDESFTQFGAGGGVGLKIPATTNLGVRLEAGATRFFENDDFFGYTALHGLVGVSLFIN